MTSSSASPAACAKATLPDSGESRKCPVLSLCLLASIIINSGLNSGCLHFILSLEKKLVTQSEANNTFSVYRKIRDIIS